MARSNRGGNLLRAATSVASALALTASVIVAIPAGAQTPLLASSDVSRSTITPSSSAFNPGRIISDENFYDRSAMSETQIQSFLAANGSVLANYRSPVASRAAVSSSRTGNEICTAFTGGDNLLASTIIYRSQQACGISAKVLLVTLQKEQSLVTRTSATSTALRIAMGYGCPDTAPCDTFYYGFGNQVYSAAKQLNNYKVGRFARQPGVHTIGWHPNAACGATTFTIENYATAALYNYTPYRPNQAALNNVPGIGDSCSSYGNRNFWYFFNLWFGASGFYIAVLHRHYVLLGQVSAGSHWLEALWRRVCSYRRDLHWLHQSGWAGWPPWITDGRGGLLRRVGQRRRRRSDIRTWLPLLKRHRGVSSGAQQCDWRFLG
jgi:hypothetical protein